MMDVHGRGKSRWEIGDRPFGTRGREGQVEKSSG